MLDFSARDPPGTHPRAREVSRKCYNITKRPDRRPIENRPMWHWGHRHPMMRESDVYSGRRGQKIARPAQGVSAGGPLLQATSRRARGIVCARRTRRARACGGRGTADAGADLPCSSAQPIRRVRMRSHDAAFEWSGAAGLTTSAAMPNAARAHLRWIAADQFEKVTFTKAAFASMRCKCTMCWPRSVSQSGFWRTDFFGGRGLLPNSGLWARWQSGLPASQSCSGM